MADTIKATPRNRLLGLMADGVGSLNDFTSKPFGTDNPPLRFAAGLLGIPAIANTLNELSYGGALSTGSGMTLKPKADTVDAALTLLPVSAIAGNGLIDGGVRLAQKAAPAIERAVPRILERGGLGSEMLQGMANNTVSPATVYHGSPYKFNKFDSSKIGTGEGAQAYGHGLYLAESPAVAKGYAENVQAPDRRGLDPAHIAAAKNFIENGMDPVEWLPKAYKNIKPNEASLAASEARGAFSPSLYKVDLPDEHIAKMLDWDKPLSQQHPDVQKIFGVKQRDFAAEDALFAKAKVMGVSPSTLPEYKQLEAAMDVSRPFSQTTGEAAYRDLVSAHGVEKIGGQGAALSAHPDQIRSLGAPNATEWLRSQGIPGIRYLDGGSRVAGQGSSNFVVFPGNEGMLKILERNGQGLLD